MDSIADMSDRELLEELVVGQRQMFTAIQEASKNPMLKMMMPSSLGL